ncbi:HK97 family phage prohead protease [Azospirillum sp. INR13]|uniref:HK97 family phage prohead protease n=1 Tax=Azospirillum sp. INR13 TaxID=2596919 RepID=UPI001891FF98|nr:HK97 family phage prohead protease [Azospirillum sp. INR13]MBF5094019.1 HK97 family phage prohead protease [Azospirillum sp. INR13]
MTILHHDIEIRFAAEDAGTFTGAANVYGTVDSYNTVFMPGAFAASLTEHRAAGTMPMMLLQHSPSVVIGAWLEIREAPSGLFVRGRLDLTGPSGRKAHAMMKAGELGGLSVGFRRRLTDTLADGTVAIRQADLIEISPVRRPSNPGARVTDVRSATAGTAELVNHIRRAAAIIGGQHA